MNTPPGSQTSPSQIKFLILAPAVDNSGVALEPSASMQEALLKMGVFDGDYLLASDNKVFVRAGFVKFADIKGESSDESSKGGKVEITWKVEEGEKAPKKSKEIVVVGSKTSDKSTPKLLQAVCGGTNAVCVPQDAVTPDALENFVIRTANSFVSITKIRIDDRAVEVEAIQKFKLFGFIPLNMKQTVSVSVEPDSFGRVKVSFPWYHIFGRKTVRPHDLKIVLEEGVKTTTFSKWEVAEFDATKDSVDESEASAGRVSETISFNFSEIKAQILHTISTVLVQYNETDLDFLNR